jgi:hypothetical protein
MTITLTNKQIAELIRKELRRQNLRTVSSFEFTGNKTTVKVRPLSTSKKLIERVPSAETLAFVSAVAAKSGE